VGLAFLCSLLGLAVNSAGRRVLADSDVSGRVFRLVFINGCARQSLRVGEELFFFIPLSVIFPPV